MGRVDIHKSSLDAKFLRKRLPNLVFYGIVNRLFMFI